ncbi:MAG: hypothetical protein AAF074_05060 [Pseudomonadota bacterium]
MELIVAVAVIGLVGTLVLVGTRPSDTALLRNAAGRLAIFFEETRLEAALRGYSIALRYSDDTRTFYAGPRRFTLPAGVEAETGEPPLAISLRPSGESGGALVRLSRGGARMAVRLDWLSGAVQVIE